LQSFFGLEAIFTFYLLVTSKYTVYYSKYNNLLNTCHNQRLLSCGWQCSHRFYHEYKNILVFVDLIYYTIDKQYCSSVQKEML